MRPEKKVYPKQFHYVCHGGSTAGPMVDIWGEHKIFICDSAKPDGGWINAPNCRECDGKIAGRLEENLSDKENGYNQAITEYEAWLSSEECREEIDFSVFKVITGFEEKEAREYWTGKHYRYPSKEHATTIATSIAEMLAGKK